MPYLRIIQWGEFDQRAYDAVMRAIDLDHKHPLGLMFHAAGEVDGRWQAVNIWESREYAEDFDRDRLEPALSRLGVGTSRHKITDYEVKHLVTP